MKNVLSRLVSEKFLNLNLVYYPTLVVMWII